MPFKDHRALHPQWENEWTSWWAGRNVATTTRQQIEAQLKTMLQSSDFAPHLATAADAHVPYTQWNLPKTKFDKSKAYRVMRSVKNVIVVAFGTLAGAQTANAALAPVLAIGDDAARNDERLPHGVGGHLQLRLERRSLRPVRNLATRSF